MWYRKAQTERIQNLIPVSPSLLRILKKLKTYGTTGLVMGGAVRDAVLGIHPKDIDIEVYGISDFPTLASHLWEYTKQYLYDKNIFDTMDSAEQLDETIVQLRIISEKLPQVENELSEEMSKKVEEQDKDKILQLTNIVQQLRNQARQLTNNNPERERRYKALLVKSSFFNPKGKQFGVLKFVDADNNDYDFSLPRRDSKKGEGHRGFEVSIDPTMSPKDAAARRDFTVNAMGYDPITQELHDYYNGMSDLKNKVLRATSSAFVEDPVRVLRGMQFAARMGLDIDDDTAQMCREIADHLLTFERNKKTEAIATISRERVAEEFMKLVTKGKYPGTALDYLQKTGWIQFFPALESLFGVPQEAEHHPEGDVAEHTKHTANAAARIADRAGLKGDDRAVLVLSAMFHDIAKPDTAAQRPRRDKAADVKMILEQLQVPEEEISRVLKMMTSHGNVNVEEFRQILRKYGVSEDEIGRFIKWTTYGHEEASGPKAAAALKEIGIKPEIIRKVEKLVPQHMAHVLRFRNEQGPRFVRQLAQDLGPANIEELARLIESDHSGRPPLPAELPEQAKNMLEKAREEGVHQRGVKPSEFVPGERIMRFFGGKGGPWIGEVQRGLMDRYLKGQITREQAGEALYEQLRRMSGFTPIITGDMLGDVPPRERKVVLDAALRAQGEGELTDENRDQWLLQYIQMHYPPVTAKWYSKKFMRLS